MSSDGDRLGQFLQRNASEKFNTLRGVTQQPVTIDLTDMDEDGPWEVGDAKLQNFNFKNCTIIGARFTKRVFVKDNLNRVVYRDCIFDACTFCADQPYDVVFEDCLFEACLFEGIPFRDMRMIRCIFDKDSAGTRCLFDERCVFTGFSAKTNAFPSARVVDLQQANVLRKLLVLGITSPRRTKPNKK